MTHRLLSIDPAAVSGWAWHEGGRLIAAAVLLKPTKTMGARLQFKALDGDEFHASGRDREWPTELAAYAALVQMWVIGPRLEAVGPSRRPERIVLERAYGPSPKSIDSLAWRRGYIAACAHGVGVDDVAEINTKSWRSVLAPLLPAAMRGKKGGWPGPSDDAKASALWVARSFGLALEEKDHDAADAVCVGAADVAMRRGQ